MNPSALLWGLLGAAAGMTLLWALQLRTRNAGIVDVGWAATLGSLGIAYALASEAPVWRRLLAGGLTGLWGFRLAFHLLHDRVWGKPEEGRYVTLRRRWGSRADRNLFVFFLAQAVLAVVLSWPFLLAVSAAPQSRPWLAVLGTVLFVVGVAGESLADRQLARFKADPANRGKVCQVGLWRYSRHPNYFFEWIIWCGFATLGVHAPWGWTAWLGPAIILFFLLRVTGIPPTEAQAVASRGEAYREYQRTTSAFVPWFRKEGT